MKIAIPDSSIHGPTVRPSSSPSPSPPLERKVRSGRRPRLGQVRAQVDPRTAACVLRWRRDSGYWPRVSGMRRRTGRGGEVGRGG